MSYDCFIPSVQDSENILLKQELKTIVSMQVQQSSKQIENQLYAALLILATRATHVDDIKASRIFDRLAIMSGQAACEAYNNAMVQEYLSKKTKQHWSHLWCYPDHIDHVQIESIAKNDVLLATLL